MKFSRRFMVGWTGRALLLGATLCLIFQPQWVRRPLPLLDVVLDASASMAEREGGRTRWELALERFKSQKSSLEKKTRLRTWVFDDTLRPFSLADSVPQVVGTRFSSLAPLADPALGGALVLLSDGRGVPPESLAGRPLFAVGVGESAAFSPAVWIEQVGSPGLAFQGKPAEVRVSLRSNTKKKFSLNLRLLKGRIVLGEALTTLQEGAGEGVLRFQPQALGPQTFQVEIDSRSLAGFDLGNPAKVEMRVGRDRMRVLYLSGQPGPQYNFLRQQLKTDPAVDLVTFVILRDPEDRLDYPEEELSLIPFPSETQLAEQLPTFDVVVWEQFIPSRIGLSFRLADALKSRVSQGGGLVLIGEGDFWGKLPITLYDLSPFSPATLPGPSAFHWEPAAVPGKNLAILDEVDPKLFKSLPRLSGSGFYPLLSPGALSLARAGEGGPVMAAYRNFGRGRVLALANLSTWRWALGSGGRGEGLWLYQQLWAGAMKFLSQGSQGPPSSRPVWDEKNNLRPDFPFLQSWAEKSQGAFVVLDHWSAAWTLNHLSNQIGNSQVKKTLRDYPIFILVIIIIGLAFWFVELKLDE